jgi:hypothetical protein
MKALRKIKTKGSRVKDFFQNKYVTKEKEKEKKKKKQRVQEMGIYDGGNQGLVYIMDHEVGSWKMACSHGPTS